MWVTIRIYIFKTPRKIVYRYNQAKMPDIAELVIIGKSNNSTSHPVESNIIFGWICQKKLYRSNFHKWLRVIDGFWYVAVWHGKKNENRLTFVKQTGNKIKKFEWQSVKIIKFFSLVIFCGSLFANVCNLFEHIHWKSGINSYFLVLARNSVRTTQVFNCNQSITTLFCREKHYESQFEVLLVKQKINHKVPGALCCPKKLPDAIFLPPGWQNNGK